MVLFSTKLIKISVPIVSSIVGVLVTSSLVSTNAEDKEKEKPLTKLKDGDPIIKEYEDANEGKCDKKKNECKGGSKGEKGQEGESGEGKGTLSSEGKDNQDSTRNDESSQPSGEVSQPSVAGDEKENKSEDQDEENGEQSDGSSQADEGDDRDSPSEQVGTDEGSKEAENANALGTRFGVEDRRMTAQEMSSLKDTRSALTGVLSSLGSMLKNNLE